MNFPATDSPDTRATAAKSIGLRSGLSVLRPSTAAPSTASRLINPAFGGRGPTSAQHVLDAPSDLQPTVVPAEGLFFNQIYVLRDGERRPVQKGRLDVKHGSSSPDGNAETKIRRAISDDVYVEETFEYGPSAIVLDSFATGSYAEDVPKFECRFQSRFVSLSLPLSGGHTWKSTARCGDADWTYEGKLEGNEVISVDGENVHTKVVGRRRTVDSDAKGRKRSTKSFGTHSSMDWLFAGSSRTGSTS